LQDIKTDSSRLLDRIACILQGGLDELLPEFRFNLHMDKCDVHRFFSPAHEIVHLNPGLLVDTILQLLKEFNRSLETSSHPWAVFSRSARNLPQN
jgi:hypothetical protein